MTYRQSEFESIGLAARWLDAERAKHAYAYALQFNADDRYGLNVVTVEGIERHEIKSDSIADAWLKSRLHSSGTVQIVYSDKDVCVVSATDFLAKWQIIFTPCRDDVIILHNLNREILFYWHEGELEFGRRRI